MSSTGVKVLLGIFREKMRRYIHPEIYRNQQLLFEERKQFYSSFLSKNDLVFDVGANMGNRVEVFLALGNKVVAIEPQSFCFAFLKAKFAPAVTVLKLALGAEKGTMTMYVNSRSSTISSLSKEWIDSVKNDRFKGEEWNSTEEVEIETLDQLILTYGVPRFIKIDVEGFETNVLKGLTKAVPMVSFEYTTPEQETKMYECLHMMQKLDPGYLCNYSTGEKNSFVLPVWLPVSEFIKKISSNVATLEGFGDIYMKLPA